MFSSLAIFVTFLSLPLASLAVQCIQCNITKEFNFTQALDTMPSGCVPTVQNSDTCYTLLSVDYQQATAQLDSNHYPEGELLFTNGYKVISNMVTILFRTAVVKQRMTVIGVDSTSHFDDVKSAYNKSKFASRHLYT